MPEYSENPYWGQVWEQFMGDYPSMYTNIASGEWTPEEFALQVDPRLHQYANLPDFASFPEFEFKELGEQFGLDVRDLQSQFGTQAGQFKQELAPELGKYTGLSMSPSAGMKRRKTIQDLYQGAIGARDIGMEELQSGAASGLMDITQDYETLIAGLAESFISADPELGEDFPYGNLDIPCVGEGCEDAIGGECPEGYYLALPESGLSGCQPISGDGSSGDYGGAPEFTDWDDASLCASKGGYWNGSYCDFEGP
jgi:hypothetical protein